MNYAGNTEIIRKHFHDHQENLCIAVILIIPLAKQFVFKKGYLLFEGAFKNIQGLCVENSRTFQGYPTIFQFSRTFQGLFKDMMLFQGLFKARANNAHCISSLIQ